MNRGMRIVVVILYVAGLASLVSACGGSPSTPEDVEQQAFEDMRAEVREIVEDPTRENSALALVDRLQSDYAQLRRLAQTSRLELRQLNADYDATPEQFADYLADYSAQLEQTHKQFRKTHRSLVEAMLAEEWDALSKSNTKSMATLAKSLVSI